MYILKSPSPSKLRQSKVQKYSNYLKQWTVLCFMWSMSVRRQNHRSVCPLLQSVARPSPPSKRFTMQVWGFATVHDIFFNECQWRRGCPAPFLSCLLSPSFTEYAQTIHFYHLQQQKVLHIIRHIDILCPAALIIAVVSVTVRLPTQGNKYDCSGFH